MSALTPFTLIPFEPLPPKTTLTVTGTLSRKKDVLSVSYVMTGDLSAIALPPQTGGTTGTSNPRKDRLWEQTCFEFFLAAGREKSDQDAYWEFNLSPDGSWNVFALSGYRTGLKEEKAFHELPFSVSHRTDELRIDISVDVSKLLPAGVPWQLGVSTVGVLADGTETFWAIAHPTPTADFHSAGSFACQLFP